MPRLLSRRALLSEIVSEAADNVMALCDLRDVRLSIDEGSDKDACIHADAVCRLSAAAVKTRKNAVEHAESEVKIGFYRYEMYAEITVQNDGESTYHRYLTTKRVPLHSFFSFNTSFVQSSTRIYPLS